MFFVTFIQFKIFTFVYRNFFMKMYENLFISIKIYILEVLHACFVLVLDFTFFFYSLALSYCSAICR